MLAKGIFFGIGDGGGPETFNQLVNTTSFTLSGTTWAMEDTTSHDNTTAINTTQTTVRNEGKISLILSPYVIGNTYHAQLRALAQSGAKNNFRVTYPQSSIGSFDFSGFVTSFAFDTPVNGLVKAKVDVTVNGVLSDDTPKLVSLTVTDAHAPTYVTGNVVELTATYDEIVKVTGTPEIALVMTSGTKQVLYAIGTDTNVLKFHYTIVSGDSALATHVSVTSPINLNSGTILDLGGNAAALIFTPPTTSSYTVN